MITLEGDIRTGEMLPLRFLLRFLLPVTEGECLNLAIHNSKGAFLHGILGDKRLV